MDCIMGLMSHYETTYNLPLYNHTIHCLLNYVANACQKVRALACHGTSAGLQDHQTSYEKE